MVGKVGIEGEEATASDDLLPDDDRRVDQRQEHPQNPIDPHQVVVDPRRRDVCVVQQELAVAQDCAREVNAEAEMAKHAVIHLRLHGAEDADGRDDVVDQGLGLQALQPQAAGVEDLVGNLQVEGMDRQGRRSHGPCQRCEEGHHAVVHGDEQQLRGHPLPWHPPVPLLRRLGACLGILRLLRPQLQLLPRLVPQLWVEAACHRQQCLGAREEAASSRAQSCHDQQGDQDLLNRSWPEG
mmetsp:Transcript_58557/g.188172  ORF Transcript_58557/g.188172 Transcript_58557/m.188172 type:complete len:239 (-) Transcript_58557:141-857(-)